MRESSDTSLKPRENMLKDPCRRWTLVLGTSGKETAIRLILSSIKVMVIARVFCGGRGLSQEPARESKDKKI